MKLLKSKKSKSKEKVSASSIGDEDWEKRHQRNSNYYDDSSDSNDSIDILNRKSGREETESSNNIDAEDLPRQRSSIWKSWKKKSSGDVTDDNGEGKKKSRYEEAIERAEALEREVSASAHTKVTQANRNTQTIKDCETEYHEAIRDHDWDFLEGILKEYDAEIYKKPKKAPKPKSKKSLKVLKYMPDMPKIKKEKEEPETPISPLLALDEDGRTPLHLCCVEPTPSKLLLRVMNCERNAAAVKDKRGNLPLHLAIQNRRKVNVIERLVRSYYQGSWTGDEENRTPLMMAIDVVMQKQLEEEIVPTKTYWAFPASPEDVKWQENQERIWDVAGFLLQNRIDRRKRLLTVEHNQIFIALNKCAPPKVISNILAMGRKYLAKDEVAGKVLFLLISRQYPIYLFQWFVEVVSVAFIKDQQDFTGCGVVAAHFRVGCIKHTDESSKRERDSFAITMKKLAFAKKNGNEFVVQPQYTEWFEKLKLLINLWATHFWNDDDERCCKEEVLLHNALINPDSPPLLIHLLAKLYPKSIGINHPKSIALPIHFACRQWQYREYPPRRGEKKINLDQICSDFLKEDSKLIRKRHRKRLPLHHAIATGKPWDFIKPLVTHDSKSLLDRDPSTSLRPFQMAAQKLHDTFDLEGVTRREYTPTVWNSMSDEDQDRQMRKLLHYYDLKQLELIYQLLRRAPGAVTKVLSPTEILSSKIKSENEHLENQLARENLETMTKMKIARSLFRLGNVEGHFIGWAYEGGLDGDWKPHRRNFPMIKEAIMDGFVPKGMDKWWRKLKFWLWQDCPWNNIPRRADFLLHCALCNPKVSPWIVELILECFPRSAMIPLPNSGNCYPLHIACVTDTYIPLTFEFPNKRNVIEMVSKAFHEPILLKWNNRLPLHYAILGSKQWSEVKMMAEDEPVSLAIPDPKNDFFPFQLVALHKSYTKLEMQRFVNIAMTSIGKNVWEKTTSSKKVEQLKGVLWKHERDSLGCIFELLKRNPMLVHVGTVESKSRRYPRDDEGASADRATNKISIQEYLNMLDSDLIKM